MSPIKGSAAGTTLLELLIAVAMISVIVIIISLVFPNAVKSITTNRQRWLANNFAAARMQEIKALPYGSIDPTPAGAWAASSGPNGCDCQASSGANFSDPSLPEDAKYEEDGIFYTRKVCIGLVSGAVAPWTTYCPNDPLDDTRDKGLKNIRIQVSWTYGAQNNTTEIEGVIAR